jgi:hypothetical protein
MQGSFRVFPVFNFPGKKRGTRLPGPGVFLASAIQVLACHAHIDSGKCINYYNCTKNNQKPGHNITSVCFSLFVKYKSYERKNTAGNDQIPGVQEQVQLNLLGRTLPAEFFQPRYHPIPADSHEYVK